MAYRVQILALFGVSGDDLKARVISVDPAFDADHFHNPEIFASSSAWSALAVSPRSGVCEHFPKLAGAASGVWLTTNNPDDWHVKVHADSRILADLHLPLANVDSDEWCEPDGGEVLESISGDLPSQLKALIAEAETGDAWRQYFAYARQVLHESLTASGIQFDSARLAQFFEEESLEDVRDAVGEQLGWFVNEVLGVGLDLSSADED